ncbi:hypothetical protein BN970_02487 [Mycolicibacterium conceptionense]|uniref:Uncharacterized protein n=1 Tax=Mycolicibacterium conceptionense TaxID=451644 RepID=A0A0U1DBN4_9MYCO|nr:hypothetical protein BN970_02487 [Mycolicibacterium conceptionense]
MVSQPRTVTPGARTAFCASMVQSGHRLRISSSATLPSTRANEAPRQKCVPRPKVTWLLALR